MKEITNPLFKGTWKDRIHPLFECGVNFTGKRILDVGCNMGVIGYEVCKRNPEFYHGMDVN